MKPLRTIRPGGHRFKSIRSQHGCALSLFALLTVTCVSGDERRHTAPVRTPIPMSESDLPTPDSDVPGGAPPIEVDEEPVEEPCGVWDGETVYCDWIMGELIILGTADSESIRIHHPGNPPVNAADKDTEVTVTHSDGSIEVYTFTALDIAASIGVFEEDEYPRVQIYVDSRCGDDIVVNHTNFPIKADLGSGDDRFVSYRGACVVDGGFGNDILYGSIWEDYLNGGPGGDIISGANPWPGVFSFSGQFDDTVFNLHPYGIIRDGRVDVLDFGPDSVIDAALAETSQTFPVVTDELLRRDYNSPPGTDLINPF